MRILLTFIIVTFVGSAIAVELVPVEDSPFNLCKPDGCIYYEWKFKSDPTLRYIASGYEDGIDYSIGRVNKFGKLELLLRVNPVIKDNTGKYWWGYPWSTHDIPVQVKNGKIYLFAYFKHKILRDGNISVLEWQKIMPVLLLNGEYGKWNIKQSKYQYKLYSISELITKSKKN